MPRYVSREGGYPPRNQDFDQSLPASVYESRVATVLGLIVHPARERTVDASTVDTKRFDIRPVQKRQSRVTVALVEPDPSLFYGAAKPGDPDVGVRFSRSSIRKSPVHGISSTARSLEGTALKEKTTVNLSGMVPLTPNTHPDFPVRIAEISDHKLAMLTGAFGGGLASSAHRDRYRRLLNHRNSLRTPQVESTEEIPWSDTDDEPSPLLSAALLHLL